MGSGLGPFEVFFKLFIVVTILFLAYVVTRFMGLKYAKNLRSKNISVIESISIGLDRILHIVKVGNQYFLISSSGKNINFLSELDPENIAYISENSNQSYQQQVANTESFSKYLDIFKNKFSNQKKNKRKSSISSYSNTGYDTYNNLQKIDKNIEKIKDISSNINSSHKNGVE